MKTLLSTLLVAFTIQLCAQDSVIDYRFTGQDSYKFEVTHTKSNSANPATQGMVIKTPVEASFDFQIDELVCTWKAGKSKVYGADNKINQEATDLYEATKVARGLTLEYTIDYRIGELNIDNVEQLKSDISKQSESIYKHGSQNNELLESTFESNEIILGMYFPAASHYLSLLGHSVNEEKAVEVEMEFPNIFGGGTIPAIRKTEVLSHRNDILNVQVTDVLDKQVFNTALVEMIAQSPNENESLETIQKEVEDSEIRIYSEYFYNSKLKLMEKVIYFKEISMLGESQLERIEVKMIKSP